MLNHTAAAVNDFARDIEPLFARHCLKCHGPEKQKGGLRLDVRESVFHGGEFGRMPVSQGNGGRDHNPNGFGMFLTGAGIRPGVHHGELDEIGYRAVVDRVSVHDLHATMLHLLGIDHKQLTYFHNSRRYRLTDVAGEVLSGILA